MAAIETPPERSRKLKGEKFEGEGEREVNIIPEYCTRNHFRYPDNSIRFWLNPPIKDTNKQFTRYIVRFN